MRYVYDAIISRRSIRKFQERSVERDLTEILLKAAMAAPSACNLQPWAFVVVDEPETLKAVKATTSQGNYNAPLAIVVCGISEHIPWGSEGIRQDCGGAAQNIMLECVELGLGSVCIGGFEEEELKGLLEIPENVEIICIIEIGYPAQNLPPMSYYTEQAVHWQKYDSKKPRTLRTIQMLREDIRKGKL